MLLIEFPQFCTHRHDTLCAQKYGNDLPYSFHLKMVYKQALKFKYLLQPDIDNGNVDWNEIVAACYGHDLIEDARITYNDIKERTNKQVAEMIFLCTEMRGRDRSERKNDQFYIELKTNPGAVFVKLCDIIANVKFGYLENSKQFARAKEEYPKIKQHLYCDQYADMFNYLEYIFNSK